MEVQWSKGETEIMVFKTNNWGCCVERLEWDRKQRWGSETRVWVLFDINKLTCLWNSIGLRNIFQEKMTVEVGIVSEVRIHKVVRIIKGRHCYYELLRLGGEKWRWALPCWGSRCSEAASCSTFRGSRSRTSAPWSWAMVVGAARTLGVSAGACGGCRGTSSKTTWPRKAPGPSPRPNPSPRRRLPAASWRRERWGRSGEFCRAAPLMYASAGMRTAEGATDIVGAEGTRHHSRRERNNVQLTTRKRIV